MKSADALMYMITGALIGIATMSLWNDREETKRLHREYISDRYTACCNSRIRSETYSLWSLL